MDQEQQTANEPHEFFDALQPPTQSVDVLQLNDISDLLQLNDVSPLQDVDDTFLRDLTSEQSDNLMHFNDGKEIDEVDVGNTLSLTPKAPEDMDSFFSDLGDVNMLGTPSDISTSVERETGNHNKPDARGPDTTSIELEDLFSAHLAPMDIGTKDDHSEPLPTDVGAALPVESTNFDPYSADLDSMLLDLAAGASSGNKKKVLVQKKGQSSTNTQSTMELRRQEELRHTSLLAQSLDLNEQPFVSLANDPTPDIQMEETTSSSDYIDSQIDLMEQLFASYSIPKTDASRDVLDDNTTEPAPLDLDDMNALLLAPPTPKDPSKYMSAKFKDVPKPPPFMDSILPSFEQGGPSFRVHKSPKRTAPRQVLTLSSPKLAKIPTQGQAKPEGSHITPVGPSVNRTKVNAPCQSRSGHACSRGRLAQAVGCYTTNDSSIAKGQSHRQDHSTRCHSDDYCMDLGYHYCCSYWYTCTTCGPR